MTDTSIPVKYNFYGMSLLSQTNDLYTSEKGKYHLYLQKPKSHSQLRSVNVLYDALQISPLRLPTKNIKVIRKCLTRRTQKSIHRQHIIFFDWVEYTHRKRAPPLTGNASLSKLDTVNFLNRELNKFSHCLRWREVMEGRTQSYIIAAISYRDRQTYSV